MVGFFCYFFIGFFSLCEKVFEFNIDIKALEVFGVNVSFLF